MDTQQPHPEVPDSQPTPDCPRPQLAWFLPEPSDPDARRNAVEQTFASFALEGILPDESSFAAAQDFIEGRVTTAELRSRLDAKYGVR